MKILHIKNMVCNRCIKVVREELEKLGHSVQHIELGKAELSKEIAGAEQEEAVRRSLSENGFELLDDKRTKLIAQVKALVINRIHYNEEPLTENFSDHISKEIGMDYSYISNLFSSVEGITIEKYIIHQRIERVKELLVYDELSLSEIAHRLGYSSVAYLSSQFKKVTGLTPSAFKELQEKNRKPLDEV